MSVSASLPARDVGEFGAIRNGDRDAFVAYAQHWLDRVHDVVLDIVGNADTAVDVTGEVFESLWLRHEDLVASDLTRDSLLLASRQRALNHFEHDGRSPPDASDVGLGGWETVSGGDGGQRPRSRHDVSAARDRAVLVRAAVSVLGASDTSLLDLYLRHGIGAAAIADELGVTEDEAPRRLARLRVDLGEVMAAFVHWHAGRPICDALATAVGDTTEFDVAAFESIGVHRQECAECARRHRSLVNPQRLFIAAPIVAVAPSGRERILSAGVASNAGLATSATSTDDRADRLAADPVVAELWASTDRVVDRPPVAHVVLEHRSARPHSAVVMASVIGLLLVAGVSVLAVRASGGDERNLSEPRVAAEAAPVDPELRSSGPASAGIEGRSAGPTPSTAATSTAPSTSSTQPEAPPASGADPFAVGPVAPATTGTSTPSRPATKSTVSSTVASASPSLPVPATTTSAPLPTSPPTVTTTAPETTAPATTQAPTTTTQAPTTTAPATTAPATTAPATTAPATTTPPTTPPTTEAPTTTAPIP